MAGGLVLARLFLAKAFLPDYPGLEKQVQSSVLAAIGKFSEHTHAGLHAGSGRNCRPPLAPPTTCCPPSSATAT